MSAVPRPAPLTCPGCGNTDPAQFEYCEMVPRYAPCHAGTVDGKVIVEISGDTMFWDGADSSEAVIYCRACDREIPAGELVEDFI